MIATPTFTSDLHLIFGADRFLFDLHLHFTRFAFTYNFFLSNIHLVHSRVLLSILQNHDFVNGFLNSQQIYKKFPSRNAPLRLKKKKKYPMKIDIKKQTNKIKTIRKEKKKEISTIAIHSSFRRIPPRSLRRETTTTERFHNPLRCSCYGQQRAVRNWHQRVIMMR